MTVRSDIHATPTAPGDVRHVLRYWLSMIRHEEALGQRLRVGPGERRGPPDVATPSRGQAYFKLMPDAVLDTPDATAGRAAVHDFLLRERPDVAFPVTGERAAFLEHYLDGSYRRERAAHFGGGDEGDGAFVVGFPTFHFAQKGELATLLRFPVDPPEWQTEGGAAWSPPRYRDRARGKGLAAPARVRLAEDSAEHTDEVPLPYALDVQQASRTLGVPEEHVVRLLNALSSREGVTPTAMLTAVTALLTAPDTDYPTDAVAAALTSDDAPEAALAALYAAIGARTLPARVRLYAVALAWDASQAMTTHGIQRDLRELASEAPPRAPDTALDAYLLGRSSGRKTRPHLGLRGPHGLTADQRAVADHALGQQLVCAQGPPGTGKTELILNLAAHTLVERFARASVVSPPTLRARAPWVVTSTNNRAVDNVIDPLSKDVPDDRLPLALRLGSRAVMQEVAVPTLARAVAWLDRGDVARATARWPALQAELSRLYETEHAAANAHVKAEHARRELPAAQARLAALEAQLEAYRDALAALGPARAEAVHEVLAGVGVWRDAVATAVGKLEDAGRVSPSRAKRLWKKARDTDGATVAAGAARLGVAVALPGPPQGMATGAQWIAAFGALERGLEALAAKVWALLGDSSNDASPAKIAALKAEEAAAARKVERLAGDAAATSGPDPRDGGDARQIRLFELACEAREVWALLHRDRLRELLTSLCATPGRARGGLRVQLEHEAVRSEFFELFPVVGCTLLSLGNGFPLERGAIDQVIIDEAGQCHPAYAVSALARARRALVIGDPHQLEPVITLDGAEEQRVLRRTACPLSTEAIAPVRAVAEAGTSAHTLAARAVDEVLTLRDHFRCQPAIIRISDALCRYGLRVRTPPASLSGRSRHLAGPLVLHDVRGEQTPRAGSWANEAEADRVTLLVRALLADGVGAGQIAVLTPYRGQLTALRARFEQARLPLEDRIDPDLQGNLFGEPAPGALALGTVHRFQGGERDVVIFSTVISRDRSLPFTNARVNLVNVAVSRARMHLLIIGHAELLARGAMTSALLRAVPAEHRIEWRPPAPPGS